MLKAETTTVREQHGLRAAISPRLSPSLTLICAHRKRAAVPLIFLPAYLEELRQSN